MVLGLFPYLGPDGKGAYGYDGHPGLPCDPQARDGRNCSADRRNPAAVYVFSRRNDISGPAHYDDIMIVQQGTATLITGGTIPDAKSGADGETHGTSIQGGKTQTLGVGDIVTVNAGVPHQLLVPAGTTYAAVVIKVKE